MKTHPPAIATWLLEHLVRGPQSEALAGDLFEEFTRRGSPLWYWRQVLKAIAASFARRARAEWFTIAFAMAWMLLVSSVWGHLMTYPRFQSLVGLGAAWNGPQSLWYYVAVFTAVTTLTLWMGLSLYLALTRRLDSRTLLRGMAVAGVLDLAINMGGLFIASMGRYRISIYLISWLPLFFALLTAIFVGRAANPPKANPLRG
jgi:hypothetical protein